MLALDLRLHQRSPIISVRKALLWSAIWIALAVAFAVVLYFWRGRAATLEFTAGYLIELSLSVDNLFIFLLIFRYFKVPSADQPRVLIWGIAGAIIMRGIFIVAGVGLLRKFEWLIYLFGAFLIYSGIRLLANPKSRARPKTSRLVRWFRQVFPVTDAYEDGRFFVRRDRLYATPLLLVLLLIEFTDLLFATDSIPAVLAITLNMLIVFTSNIFAILGLRSMYFALAGMMENFEYLHYGLSVILILIGAKMAISRYYEIPTWIALITVACILLFATVFPAILSREDIKLTGNHQ